MKITNNHISDFVEDIFVREEFRFDDHKWHSAEFSEEKTIVTDEKKRINRENPLPVLQMNRESHSKENKTGSSRIAPNSLEKEPELFKRQTKCHAVEHSKVQTSW